MAKVLIIGAGGVGRVVAHKCAQLPEVFEDICLASRRIHKCHEIQEECPRPISIAELNADRPEEVVSVIRDFSPDVVINVALPYQDLPIMDACLETGVDYLDTANYEPRDVARMEYKWQWAYHERFREAGIMALLGSGFDPGVTNVFIAHAIKHHFDSVNTVDILDCNAGDHGKAFATNFNPEINIREITAPGRYFQNGIWQEIEALSEKRSFDFPGEIGEREMYLLYHEEMESLVKHFPEIDQMRFWMTFSKPYLTHLKVLENVGMTRIDPIVYEGREVIPLQFLKALLPDPGSLGKDTKGKTCIGCILRGKQADREKNLYVYNICDHESAYADTRSQAISYTTGVPAMIGALLMVTGVWKKAGVYNMEQFDPDPFMKKLTDHGLPWHEMELSDEQACI